MDIAVREARPSDAEQLITYVQRLIEEPGIQVALSPGEFDLTAEEERDILAGYVASKNSIYLVAEVGAEIVGTLICTGGKRRTTRHVATLDGMSVARARRRQGIGSLLMTRVIAWARETGVVKRLELSVFARNKPAISLYQAFGFVVEGCRRRAIYRGGRYLDDLMMGRLLEEASEAPTSPQPDHVEQRNHAPS